MGAVMYQHVIYENPSDFPGKWVLRRWAIVSADDGEVKIEAGLPIVADSLEGARLGLPIDGSLHRVPRQPGDDPVIVEVWL